MFKEDMFGFWFAIPFVIIMIVVGGWTFITSDSEQDFKTAKTSNNVVTCNGLLKSYVLQPDQYTVYEDTIRAKVMFINRTFKMKNCNVENSVKGKEI